MGHSRKYGPLLATATNLITAPNIKRYQNGTLNFGNRPIMTFAMVAPIAAGVAAAAAAVDMVGGDFLDCCILSVR